MKAKHFFILAIVLSALGIVIPYGMYMNDVQQAEGWEGIFWLIIAPTVYSYIAIPFWIFGFILLVVGIWRWKNG